MRRRLSLVFALAIAGGSAAQPPVLDTDRAALIDAKRSEAEAEARAAAFQAAAARAGNEADRARAEAAALTLRVQAAEADLRAGRARIALIAGLQAEQRRRIARRQGPILHLLAALQTMARRPPALALAQPGSVTDLVHVRLLLADAMPVVAARTAGLRAELARAARLRGAAEQAVAAQVRGAATLATRRTQLAALEATAIRRSQLLSERAAAEAQRALGLGAAARDLADDIQVRQAAGDVRDALMRLPSPAPRPGEGGGVPVHEGPPRYLLPVRGDVASGYGEVSDAGVRARGLTIAAEPSATVVAPQAGTILFAHGFRSYGGVVIIAHGGGWTTTVTGLATMTVAAGQAVRQGDTIGQARRAAPAVTTELRRGGRPIDIGAMVQAE